MQEIKLHARHERFIFICLTSAITNSDSISKSPDLWDSRVIIDAVSASSPAEERLLSKLMNSSRYNHLIIPVSDVGESVQANIGLNLQKIIEVVRNYGPIEHIDVVNNDCIQPYHFCTT